MTPMQNIELLDCTLRDGGYYNDWDFDRDLVQKYLTLIAKSGIRYVELGFRQLPQSRFLGAYAYTTDLHVRSFDIPPELKLGVMVDAKALLVDGRDARSTILSLFTPKAGSPIDFVRIAVNFASYKVAKEAAETLSGLGYLVGFNLMQSDGRSRVDIAAAAADIAQWNTVDILYFADSLGNMKGQEVADVVEALRSGWTKPLGIHTHDNQGMGLMNSLTAVENGVTWLDATVLGMGRGAGNTCTETLLGEVMDLQDKRYDPSPIYDLVVNEFAILKEQYKWGTNLFYHLAAKARIHPTFVQEMLSDGRYTHSEMLHAIAYMSTVESHSYSADLLTMATSGNCQNDAGSWNGTGLCEGRDVLILGAGPSIQKYGPELVEFIKHLDLFVLSLNVSHSRLAAFANANVVVNAYRAAMDVLHYEQATGPLIAPQNILDSFGNSPRFKGELRNYGLRIEKGSFEMAASGCVLPSALAIGYALSIATMGGARRIFLAGFDGYGSDEPRQKEMINLLDLYARHPAALELCAVTPSNYPIKHGSLFAPGV